jgi:hypothetical protein
MCVTPWHKSSRPGWWSCSNRYKYEPYTLKFWVLSWLERRFKKNKNRRYVQYNWSGVSVLTDICCPSLVLGKPYWRYNAISTLRDRRVSLLETRSVLVSQRRPSIRSQWSSPGSCTMDYVADESPAITIEGVFDSDSFVILVSMTLEVWTPWRSLSDLEVSYQS